jgi:UDP-glucose 4-epimerase
MPRVLIAGGAGFIGSHLVRRCLMSQDDVHVAVRPETNRWRLSQFGDKCQIHSIDLTDPQGTASLMRQINPEVVYYLASQTRRIAGADFSDVFGGLQNDVVALMNVLAAAARIDVRCFVRAGTIAEYGIGPVPFVETQREMPLNAYAASMTSATHFCQMIQSRISFPVLHARLALTYGPSQSEDFLVPDAIRSCLESRKIRLQRPDDRRDLIFVDDVVDGLVKMSSAQLPGGTILNLVTGNAPTMRDLAQVIVELCGVSHDLIDVACEGNGPSPAHVLWSSPKRASELLSWRAGTPLQEGLRKTVEVMRQTPAAAGSSR